MSPVQSIPPTVTIASPPNSNNATSYYNNHNIIENYNNNNNNNYNNKYHIGRTATTATTTINRTERPQKVMSSDALSIGGVGGGGGGGAVSVEQSAVAAVAMWPYSHLYADRAAVAAAMYGHGPPIMFSSPAAHPMFSVSTPVPAHAYKLNNNNNNNNNSGNGSAAPSTITDSNAVFTSAYLKAIQNAVTASIFNPTQMTSQLQTPPPPQQQQQQHHQHQTTSQIHSQMSPVQNLTPPMPTLPKSPTLLAASMSSLAVSSKSSNNKTYLNEKSINVKNMTTTDDVNYFKVPSGKEGSLKHRILTRPHAQNLSTTTSTTTSTTNSYNNSYSNCDENNRNTVMRTYDSTSNFRRGSYIELENSVLRKVEDMRTEDFIQCAERSPQHKLAESTVVKIDLTPANTVIITFSYDNNRSRADVEVSHDHPFFVYGQGWASYNPDASEEVFGLKCQRLQVGDICISLTIREPDENEYTVQSQQQQQQQQLLQATTPPTTAATIPSNMPVTSTAMNMTMSAVQPTEYSRYQLPATEQYVVNANVLPLSPHTPPGHLNLPPTHYAVAPGGLPYHILPPHLTASLVGNTHPYTSAEMADLVSAYAYHAHLASTAPPPQAPSTAKVLGNHHHYYHNNHHSQPQTAHIYHTEGANMSKDYSNKMHSNQDGIDYKPYAARYNALVPPVSNHSHHGYATDGSHFLTHPHHHHPHHHQQQQQQHQQHQQHLLHQHNHHLQIHQPLHNHQQPQQEEPVDATIARKRRWSAPEGVCEDDEDDIKNQPVRLSSVSSTTSSSSSSMQQHNNNNNNNNNSISSSSSSTSSISGVNMYKIFKPSPVVAAAPPL